MTSTINITVHNPSLPPGAVRIQDTANLCQGLYEVITKLIQLELGYSDKIRLKDESKRLASIVLTKIKPGSGVLCHEPLPIEGVEGRHPAICVTTGMIQAMNQHEQTGTWPNYFPVSLRNKLGSAIETTIDDNSTISFSVKADGPPISCDIDYQMKEALKKPEVFATDEAVDCVGDMLNISWKTRTFKVYTEQKPVTVYFSDDQKAQVDSLRWKTVYVNGYPLDPQCTKIGELLEIREANDNEDTHITVENNDSTPEYLPSYQYVERKISEFHQYEKQWDSYNAKAPSKQVLKFALNFYKEVCSVLMNHDIEIPDVFVVPTPLGGIQYEWIIDGRELEVEIPRVDTFEFLAVTDDGEIEGEASRWNILRFIKWVVTGEEYG